MPNSKQWSSATPGHIVLMLDTPDNRRSGLGFRLASSSK
jgi:hypothetical protein